MSDKIYAPFTPEQVEALNEYQESNFMHAFTCGRSGEAGCLNGGKDQNRDLIATCDGWVCPCGNYKQDWAHAFTEDPVVVKKTQDLQQQIKELSYESIEVVGMKAAASSVGWSAISVQWNASFGFGEIGINVSEDGTISIDHEAMSKEFCIAVMTKLIEKYYK